MSDLSKRTLQSLKNLERFSGISPILAGPDIISSFRSVKAKYSKSVRIITKPNRYYQKDLDKIDRLQIDKKAMQDIVSERLWKGRVVNEPKIPKVADIESETKVNAFADSKLLEEETNVNYFLNKLTVFSKIRDLLLMNFRISKLKDFSIASNVEGVLIELKEELEKLDKNLKIDEHEILSHFTSLNSYIRQLIRILKYHQDDSAAEVLEILWRFIIKLFDNALYTHFILTSEFTEIIHKQNRDIFEEKTQEIQKIQQSFNSQIKTLSEENFKLKETILKISEELETSKSDLLSKKNEFKNLIKSENRVKDLINMQKLLSGFDSLIEDTEKERVRQIMVLQSVASLIDSAEEMNSKKENFEKEAQTEPFNLDIINCESSYEDYIKTFGSSFGEIGSMDSINAFVSLIKRDLEPKSIKRNSIKKKKVSRT